MPRRVELCLQNLIQIAETTEQLLLPEVRISDILSGMKHVPKETTDDALVQEFLNKGGKISVGKTKPMPVELVISKNVWNNKLTKEEKFARDNK